MKNLFTIIAASLLLGTASMAAADPDFVIVSAEHTGIDNNPAYLDLRPNDTTRHLYIWENTATGETLTDTPYEGGEYLRLHVASGWFGLGFVSDDAVDMSVFSRKNMVLHFAVRTKSTCPLFVKLEGGTYPGSARVDLKGIYDVARDGEWHLIQIPMTDFLYQGLDWSTPIAGKNYFALVSEQSQTDYLLSFDAITIEAGEPQPVDEPRPDVDKSKLADYVLIAAEDGVVPAGKNVLDLRPNGSDINLYVWENTAAENPTVDGEAFEGAQYSSLLVQNSWFGFGVMNSSPKDFTCFQYKDFRFHAAMRTTSQMPLELRFEGLGSAVVELDETMLPRDGKWHEIEFPYSDLAAQGLVWDGEQMGKNFMSLVSEQAENGAVLDFDAIYFYSTGDKEDSVAQLPAATTLTFDGTTLRTTVASRIVVCNVMGQMVANTEATEVSTAGWQLGLYIARQGNAVVKFVVK